MPSVDNSCLLHHDYEGFVSDRRTEGSYDSAFNRLGRSGRTSHWGSDILDAYERANHIAGIIIDRRPKPQKSFLELSTHIEKWKSDTNHWSSITKMLAHPSYLRIIGLSKHCYEYEVEKALLLELATEPDYWFAALTAITGADPIRPEQDFDEAVDAWLTWGREKGII